MTRKTYRINEIFYSLQGEGAFTGTPVVFVRFSGCNRRCPFCDTEFDQYAEMTVGQIIEAIAPYPTRRVVLTGGEPLLQVDAALIDSLHDAGRKIHIETNGTLPVPDGIDWVTCSPKDTLPAIQPERVDELKIVFTGQSDDQLDCMSSHFPAHTLRFLQPCSGSNIPQTVAKVLARPEWRLSLQTHKLIDIK